MNISKYSFDDASDAFRSKDYERVLGLAMPHAAAGDSDAQTMVALLYDCGLGVKQDALEAERWLLKAAEQNNPVAWNNLGTLYASKRAELKDRWSEATRCYDKAKALGFNCAAPYPPEIR